MSILRTLWIGSLPPLPPDPSNAVADDPRAAEFGHRLFFDKRLSANGQVACATCHVPELAFTDGQPVAHGTRPNPRHTMSIAGAAYAPKLLWDGRKDSLWAQAVQPIEAVDEQGATRLHAAHLIANDDAYRTAYTTIFGPLPDLDDYARFPDAGGPVDFLDYRLRWDQMTAADQEAATRVLANMGKAIAAYERLISPGSTRLDDYLAALLTGDQDAMNKSLAPNEVAGLRLFIGKARCIRCHNGPLFSDFDFHNTGAPAVNGLPPDAGRAAGLERAMTDEFRCAGAFSDALPEDCPAAGDPAQVDPVGAFRTPMLRNVAVTAPYLHAGQFASLDEVVAHYSQAPRAAIGRTELEPLDLDAVELAQIAAFLRSLNAAPALPTELLTAPRPVP